MRGERIDPYEVHDATASEIVLDRCQACRGMIMLRLVAFVTVRGGKLSVQVHTCTRCWHLVHRHVERI